LEHVPFGLVQAENMRISLIPSASSNYKNQADYDVITSFLSKEVANVAEGKAIKSM
jgi:hypothetical protein